MFDDADGDGIPFDRDCDDDDPEVGEETEFFADVDADGRGDDRISITACDAPSGFVSQGGDVEPECATDDTDDCGICGGGNRDKDCNGVCFGQDMPDACGVCGGDGGDIYHADADGDGLGDPAEVRSFCGPPMPGWVRNGEDPEPACVTNDSDECGVCAGPGQFTVYEDSDGDELGDPAVSMEVCETPDGYVSNADDRDPTCAVGDATCEVCVGRRFIVQWDAVPAFSRDDGGPYTFELILHESGNIEFQYAIVEPYGASATVGMQYAGGDPQVDLAHNSTFIPEHPYVFIERIDAERYRGDYFEAPYWLDLQDRGTPLNLGDDDQMEVEIGFAFPFYDQMFDRLMVNSNGIVFFGTAPSAASTFRNEPFPVADMGHFIAPFWDDFNPSGSGQVYVYQAPATCDRDCNGEPGGWGEIDSCGTCANGPEDEPFIDCHGTCGGTAAIDGCGMCAGGETGLEPLDLDCTGACGGTAYFDACGVCVGGSTGLPPSDPMSCPNGPDLIVDEADLRETVHIDYVEVPTNSCLINENCVRGTGSRKVIRFATTIANIGNEDMQVGVGEDGNPLWEYDECHNHFHFEAYADYALYDVDNDVALTDIGHKNGFCVLDIGPYQGRTTSCTGYSCGEQGISAGCYDRYSAGLQCQWIDVTGLPDGTYDVIVSTNPHQVLRETNYDNNGATVRVQMTGDALTVVP